VGVKQVADDMWLVTFMHYDPEYFGDETCILEPVDNPFGLKRDLFLRPPPSG
jgi:putative transposase